MLDCNARAIALIVVGATLSIAGGFVTARAAPGDRTASRVASPATAGEGALESFPDDGAAMLAAGGAEAATELRAQAGCDPHAPRKALVTLRWRAAEHPGSEQRVGLTTHAQDFDARAFVTTTSLSPSAESVVLVQSVSPGIIHYWRVLTRQDAGWVSSEVGSFEGPICVADSVHPPP